MEEKTKNKRECPEGNDPASCALCKEAERAEWRERQEFRRKIHGLV